MSMSVIIMLRNSYKPGHCYWTIPIRNSTFLGPVVTPSHKVAYAAIIAIIDTIAITD